MIYYDVIVYFIQIRDSNRYYAPKIWMNILHIQTKLQSSQICCYKKNGSFSSCIFYSCGDAIYIKFHIKLFIIHSFVKEILSIYFRKSAGIFHWFRWSNQLKILTEAWNCYIIHVSKFSTYSYMLIIKCKICLPNILLKFSVSSADMINKNKNFVKGCFKISVNQL